MMLALLLILWPLTAAAQTEFILPVPFHKQEHKLSCEAATLRMALLFVNKDISENDIIANTPFGPMDADPDFNFVGSIDGTQTTTGYGIHWDALAQVAANFSEAEAFHRRDLHFLIDRLHENRPPIIWGSYVTRPRNVSWTTPEGKYIHAVQGEHTFVVIGYRGERRAPSQIIILDPLRGRKIIQTGDFLTNWSLYHNSGIFLK